VDLRRVAIPVVVDLLLRPSAAVFGRW